MSKAKKFPYELVCNLTKHFTSKPASNDFGSPFLEYSHFLHELGYFLGTSGGDPLTSNFRYEDIDDIEYLFIGFNRAEDAVIVKLRYGDMLKAWDDLHD